MPSSGSSQPSKKSRTTSPLMVRLDKESKAYLARAAELRCVSVSDYVRSVTVAQARREVLASRDQTVAMTLEEQLAFWNALNETPRLTERQRRLGSVMQGPFVSSGRLPHGFRLEPLRRAHPRRSFRCGEEKVDDWLATKALQHQEKRLSVTKVLSANLLGAVMQEP
jgi:uncharacterized protein (DUF1778 family)